MRAIFVVLLIVAASTAAQTMRARALVHQNDGYTFPYTGTLTFLQASPTENVAIKGKLRDFAPGQYIVVLHEESEWRGNCYALGKIQDVHGRPFRLFYFVTHVSGESVLPEFFHGTLMPDEPKTVVNRTFSIYDVQKFEYHNGHTSSPSVACGHIVRI